MSLDLVMGDSIFASGIGIDLPVTNGLRSFGLGGDLFGVNLVEDGTQPKIVGNPARIDAYSTMLGPNGYLDLNIKESENFTCFAIFKLWNSGGGGNTQLIGTFQNYTADGTTAVVGSGIVFEAPGYRDVICSTYDGGSGASTANNVVITDVTDLPTTEATASWRCLVGCYDGLGVNGTPRQKRIIDKTSGKSGASTIATGVFRDMRGTSNVLVGNTGPRVAQTKSLAFMGYAYYDRQLTNAEITLMYNRYKDIGSIQGVSI